jgi:F-type H+-transporting ATPase subunit gamma
MKLIKRRIESVSSTQQIMKAMNLVATSKLQKAKSRLDTLRPMFTETKRMISSIELGESTRENIFVMKRDGKNAAYIIITSDRGLCGGYNTNVSKEALAHISECNKNGKNEKIVTVGGKGWDYFRRRGKSIVNRFKGVGESASFAEAEQVGRWVLEKFSSKDEAEAIQEVYIAYTHFESMLTHVPKVEKILPLSGGEGFANAAKPMSYEPNVAEFLDNAIPMYVNVFIYGAMMESAACEQAARMMSMDSAANNAEDIIDDLTLAYNRKRQGIITQEINEIVSGANALQ